MNKDLEIEIRKHAEKIVNSVYPNKFDYKKKNPMIGSNKLQIENYFKSQLFEFYTRFKELSVESIY